MVVARGIRPAVRRHGVTESSLIAAAVCPRRRRRWKWRRGAKSNAPAKALVALVGVVLSSACFFLILLLSECWPAIPTVFVIIFGVRQPLLWSRCCCGGMVGVVKVGRDASPREPLHDGGGVDVVLRRRGLPLPSTVVVAVGSRHCLVAPLDLVAVAVIRGVALRRSTLVVARRLTYTIGGEASFIQAVSIITIKALRRFIRMLMVVWAAVRASLLVTLYRPLILSKSTTAAAAGEGVRRSVAPWVGGALLFGLRDRGDSGGGERCCCFPFGGRCCWWRCGVSGLGEASVDVGDAAGVRASAAARPRGA